MDFPTLAILARTQVSSILFCDRGFPPPHIPTRSAQVALHTYVKIVSEGISDTVPKQVNLYLVSGVVKSVADWMLKKVSRDDLERWLIEDPQSRRKREELERKRAQFQEGLEIIREVKR